MGMFDTMEGLDQVKCFNCELDNYNIGSIIPTEENGYSSNLAIIDDNIYESSSENWHRGVIGIIRNSIFEEYVDIMDLNGRLDILDGMQVINTHGKKIKIKNVLEMFDFIEDKIEYDFNLKKIERKCDFKRIINNVSYSDCYDKMYQEEDELYEKFKNKWYIK